jgi:TonB family protein
MAYQALLFCPDEKTARTVTQVLSELDFEVIACTEPFAAVKKLMAEHFDAVVVDCDNEQNATLLYKSARNAPNNQSALAVAVVEGQAGVAKAFRIGANLVLTKPINVEQAKGTLRVARGLLRKNEATKPAPAAGMGAVKPTVAPAPPKLVPPAANPRVVTARPPAPVAPLATRATANIPAQKPTPQPTVVASAPNKIDETAEPFEAASEEIAAPPVVASSITTASKISPKIETVASQPIVLAPTPSAPPSPSSGGFGAASAPAPAREKQSSVSTEVKSSTAAVSEPENPVSEVAASANDSSVGESTAPAPEFTFGGNVTTAPAGSGSKKGLLAVAAVVLIAAAGYAAWNQFGHSNGTASSPAPVAVRPAASPTVAPPVAASAGSASSVSPSSAASALPSSTQQVADSTTDSLTTKSAKVPAATSAISDTDNAPVQQHKVKAASDSPKPAATTVAANTAPAAAQPIMVKNGNAKPGLAKSESASDESAPSISGIAAAGNGGSLPNLMTTSSSAPAPVLQTMNVSQGVSQGLLIKHTQPSYPPNALRMRIEGSVQLLATISKTGDISGLKILSGDPGLARAAAEAVKQWKYRPYLLDGAPVEIQTQVTVNFKLPR